MAFLGQKGPFWGQKRPFWGHHPFPSLQVHSRRCSLFLFWGVPVCCRWCPAGGAAGTGRPDAAAPPPGVGGTGGRQRGHSGGDATGTPPTFTHLFFGMVFVENVSPPKKKSPLNALRMGCGGTARGAGHPQGQINGFLCNKCSGAAFLGQIPLIFTPSPKDADPIAAPPAPPGADPEHRTSIKCFYSSNCK